MRQVGEILGRRRADRFVDFLTAQKVAAELREDGDDRFIIWVIDEDNLPVAEEHYRAFRAAPEAPVFDVVAPPKPVAPKAAPVATGRSRYIDVRSEIFDSGQKRLSFTIALIVISSLLTLVNMTPRKEFLDLFFFSGFPGRDFPEIVHGQVWRLVTPVFIHGSPLHLLFNMMWLYQLGGSIEVNEGKRYYGFFLLALAVFVNTVQYLLHGPDFMGMSGVVYGLLGYVWMMSRYEVASRYAMATNTALFMLGWLVICLLGVMGPNIANTEHVAGLIAGTLWGLLRSGFFKTWFRQQKYKKNRGE